MISIQAVPSMICNLRNSGKILMDVPSIKLRGSVWHINTTIHGERIRCSLQTTNKTEAMKRAAQLVEAARSSQQHQFITELNCGSSRKANSFEISDEEIEDNIGWKFNSDAEFWKIFSWFNELNPNFFWKTTEARKNHTDEFGDTILDGEVYFSRNLGSAFNNVQKVSRRSMETMLYMLFDKNPLLEQFSTSLKLNNQHEFIHNLESISNSSTKS